MGGRSEKVGERGQMFMDLRRIVDLCNEKIAGSDFSRQPPWMGVKRRDVLNKIQGYLDRFPTFAVDSSIIRQPPRYKAQRKCRDNVAIRLLPP